MKTRNIKQKYWNQQARHYALCAWATFSLMVCALIWTFTFSMTAHPVLAVAGGCSSIFFAFATKINLTNHSHAQKRAK